MSLEKRSKNEPNLEIAKASIKGEPRGGRGIDYYTKALNISPSSFENKRVLEVGGGADLRFARELESAGIKAEVVSISPAFAEERWRSQALSTGRDSATRRMAAAWGEQLPFADAAFDRIVCLNVTQHLTYPDEFMDLLREFVRVLSIKGEAYISPIDLEGEDDEKSIAVGYVSKDEARVRLVPEADLTSALGDSAVMSYLERPALDLHQSQGQRYYTLVLRKNV